MILKASIHPSIHSFNRTQSLTQRVFGISNANPITTAETPARLRRTVQPMPADGGATRTPVRPGPGALRVSPPSRFAVQKRLWVLKCNSPEY